MMEASLKIPKNGRYFYIFFNSVVRIWDKGQDVGVIELVVL